MPKPIVFFSHSSNDGKVLSRLKTLFVEKTGGTIEAFLSSDGQSIRLGRNWVSRVEDALDQAAIVVVFLTPTALESGWVFFEAGYAYAKQKEVVPVGFLGFEIEKLRPPLSLLQGFNIKGKDGLDNLITIVNEHFNHSHSARFSEEDFESIVALSPWRIANAWGEYGSLVESIQIELGSSDSLKCTAADAVSIAGAQLAEAGIEHRSGEREVEAPGLHAFVPGGISPERIRFLLDPLTIDGNWGALLKTIEKVRDAGMEGIETIVAFDAAVAMVRDPQKVSARLLGAGVKFGEQGSYKFKDIEFSFSHFIQFFGREPRRGKGYLTVKWGTNTPQLGDLRELITTMFEREVFFIAHQEFGGE